MKIAILGSAGYLGIALTRHLIDRGFDVCGCDNFWRDRHAKSLTSVRPLHPCFFLDITNYDKLRDWLKSKNPDVIVHLAEQPSAPYSMKGPKEAAWSQYNNVVGSLNVLYAIKEINPDIHLVKLGTAGEYPDWLYPPEITIPENPRIDVQYRGVNWTIPTPRYFGSWYHASKFFDSYNCDYANRIWGLNITDINQAPVYGYVPGTRFDYDECFGTVVNRFVAQALAGYPLTVYGTGGQTRGYIHIQNSMEAIELVIQNRPEGYQTLHQLTETKSVMEIAELVQGVTGCGIQPVENPRAEAPDNKFNFEANILAGWGLRPLLMQDTIKALIEQIRPFRGGIDTTQFEPKIKWAG